MSPSFFPPHPAPAPTPHCPPPPPPPPKSPSTILSRHGAYGAFMFAFLVCQDQSMCTLMVFLYQFQQTYGNFMIMASLVITAIPTLVVFVLCQRVILRGIVIPTFK